MTIPAGGSPAANAAVAKKKPTNSSKPRTGTFEPPMPISNQLRSAAAVADDRERRPEQWMSIGIEHPPLRRPNASVIDHAHHRLVQRLGTCDAGTRRLPPKQVRHELASRSRI